VCNFKLLHISHLGNRYFSAQMSMHESAAESKVFVVAAGYHVFEAAQDRRKLNLRPLCRLGRLLF
jgi:translation elongation factor EF-1alpha